MTTTDPRVALAMVEKLIADEEQRERYWRAHFSAAELNRDGMLNMNEAINVTNTMCNAFGIDPPSVEKVVELYCRCDKNRDHVLSEDEFGKFFQAFLPAAQKQLEDSVPRYLEELEKEKLRQSKLRGATKEEAATGALTVWQTEKKARDAKLSRPKKINGAIEGPKWSRGGKKGAPRPENLVAEATFTYHWTQEGSSDMDYNFEGTSYVHFEVYEEMETTEDGAERKVYVAK